MVKLFGIPWITGPALLRSDVSEKPVQAILKNWVRSKPNGILVFKSTQLFMDAHPSQKIFIFKFLNSPGSTCWK